MELLLWFLKLIFKWVYLLVFHLIKFSKGFDLGQETSHVWVMLLRRENTVSLLRICVRVFNRIESKHSIFKIVRALTLFLKNEWRVLASFETWNFISKVSYYALQLFYPLVLLLNSFLLWAQLLAEVFEGSFKYAIVQHGLFVLFIYFSRLGGMVSCWHVNALLGRCLLL